MRRCWLGMLLVMGAPAAQAVSQEIQASFSPDPSNPQKNVFINKTPESGYCVSNPVECRNNNTFSIRLPVRFDSARALQPDGSQRNNAMVKVPAQWRALTVTNAVTGESERVEVRVAGIGSQYRLSDTAANLTGAPTALQGHQTLWTNSSWVYAPPPCVYSGVGYYSDTTYAFFWKTPIDGSCTKMVAFAIPAMSYDYLDFAYELRTPNPLGMSSGQYTGSLSYRLGPGGDFDMGDVMLPTDPQLTLDFVLDVQHTLKVDIPPGGDKVQLAPAGGWQGWINAGRRPVRLFRDQTFHISASSRFSMYRICNGEDEAILCKIINPQTRRFTHVDVSVSLPNGMTDVAGQPVKRQLLSAKSLAQRFQPGFYVDRGIGTLHFEVMPESIDKGFLTNGPYRGDITVVWDSEI
ncbi:hypothetical protein KVG96_02745 [Pseudomonas sp. COR58]|uniref:Fimbrial protein n=1 Tax=Pseudomonas ekonensis TaxID=2842353 RepID=A0ABS6P8S8_9PSED|nr:hypothetical protein [Pseudomonas ekonensis]MBV4456863.1 hypothetical protein [Pseudomonas ekonensis]